MSPWHYASTGGLNYPVQPGDVWRAGPHVIACGDLEAGDGLRLVDKFGAPDLVYSDPPWNDGNAGAFRTKAGTPRQVNFTAFLDQLLTVVRMARRDVFLEMGLANAPHLMDLALDRKINPGKVFDLELPLSDVAEGYRAMDERRAIKVLLRV